jgi:asparagine synthase (glutamine-hydrolysing)
MCGIFGLVNTPWRKSGDQALATLGLRGPDDREWLDLGEAQLGHTRLSVIDLSAGHQPMRTADGRYAIVFNGEIYNYRELRQELLALGHVFTTQSDTEVLLHGYAAWGADLPRRLDGMFAFAVWDGRERTLFMARDRIGIKPLFYSTYAGLAFGSTLAPFRALDGFPLRLDWEALRDYLAYQTCLAPHSLLADVRQLPPAGWLRYEAGAGRISQGLHWTIPGPGGHVPDQAELVEQVDAAIAESVRRQMVADVPLGAFLSGGVDSSLMVHYMAQAGVHPLKTFSLRFAQEGFDETAHARAVAAQYGCEHHVLDAPAIEGDDFIATLADLDQPLADPAYVMTHALSRLTRAHVTVAISGDGGDELFAGYARYQVQESDFPTKPGQALARRMVEAGLLPGAMLRRTLSGQERMIYRQAELGPWTHGRKSLARYLMPEALAACHPERTLERWRDLASSWGGRMDTASLMRADLWTYLSENCLTKTDRASMAHSLEVRVPLLGNPVLDLALGLPASAHFDAGGGKALLRALARRHLPETVWNRPKHGFSVPLHALFNGAWRDVGEDVVTRAGKLAPFLRPGAVRDVWRQARAGKGAVRLAYTLVVLLIWLDRTGLQGLAESATTSESS